jgi:hypothetical protein
VNYREKAEDLHEFIISNPCEACVETMRVDVDEEAALAEAQRIREGGD